MKFLNQNDSTGRKWAISFGLLLCVMALVAGAVACLPASSSPDVPYRYDVMGQGNDLLCYEQTSEINRLYDLPKLYRGVPQIEVTASYDLPAWQRWLTAVATIGLPQPACWLWLMMLGCCLLLCALRLRRAAWGGIVLGLLLFLCTLMGGNNLHKWLLGLMLPPLLAAVVWCFRRKWLCGAATLLFALVASGGAYHLARLSSAKTLAHIFVNKSQPLIADRLPRATAAAMQVRPQAVVTMLHTLQSLPDARLQHALVLRHGHVIAEVHASPFRCDDTRALMSVSKTVTALAVGLAVDDGLMTVTDTISALLPDSLLREASPRMASLTVRHLLTLTTGVTPDWALRGHSDRWLRDWLAKPVTDRPGTRFQYDSMPAYVLAAIVQHLTGQTLLDYVQQRIFTPLCITDAQWELSPEGVNTGGWGLRMTAESLAKVGQLMLQRGAWKGRQLISAGWLDEMTSFQVPMPHRDKPRDWNQGFGYNTYRCLWPTAYRAYGTQGQFLVVDPSTDMVVVILGIFPDEWAELNAVWQLFMRGITARPAAAGEQARLDSVMAAMSRPSLAASDVADFRPVNVRFAPNAHDITALRISRKEGYFDLEMTFADGHDERLALGNGEWKYSPLKGFPPYEMNARSRFAGLTRDFVAAGTCRWNADRVQVQLCYVNWGSGLTLDFLPAQGALTITDTFSKQEKEVVKCQ
ncbi:MAG: serine hydrolase [Muribaculaceae bacterium]|nr:serine hydrolase [Muribaculaceae bacterium]